MIEAIWFTLGFIGVLIWIYLFNKEILFKDIFIAVILSIMGIIPIVVLIFMWILYGICKFFNSVYVQKILNYKIYPHH